MPRDITPGLMPVDPSQFAVDGVSPHFILSVLVGVRALLVVVGLTAGLVVAACSGGDDSPAASASSSSSSSSTSTTVGVDEVPDEITVEYVQRVMDALDASWGDMYRLYVSSGGPTAETAAWLDALYDEPELSRIDVDLGEEAADGFDSTREDTGEPFTMVEEVIGTSTTCVFFVAQRHFNEVLTLNTTDNNRSAIALRATSPLN